MKEAAGEWRGPMRWLQAGCRRWAGWERPPLCFPLLNKAGHEDLRHNELDHKEDLQSTGGSLTSAEHETGKNLLARRRIPAPSVYLSLYPWGSPWQPWAGGGGGK